MRTLKTTIRILFLSTLCLHLSFLRSAAQADAFSKICPDLTTPDTTLVAGVQVRGYGEQAVEVELADAGILTLDLLVPATERVDARLISSARAQDWHLERSARHSVLIAPGAGSWVFQVAAEDPLQELGAWRLRTGFVPATSITARSNTGQPTLGPDGSSVATRELRFDPIGSPKTDEQEIDPDPFAAGDPILTVTLVRTASGRAKTDEQEIDPDPLALGRGRPAKTDEQEIDPDPFASGCDRRAKTDEQEIDPDPFAGWQIRSVQTVSKRSPEAPLAAELRIAGSGCRLDALDDHGDTPGCATLMAAGQRLPAELGNGWGDDADVFTFTLDETCTVWIESRGTVDTLGTLMDRYGHRLAMNGDDGFRLVKVLAPGPYFLRIEGSAGAEGDYQLAFATKCY